MKPIILIALTIVVATTSVAWPQIQKQITPSPVKGACAQGFSAGSYPNASAGNYECKTPLIKCPAKTGYVVGTVPQPVADSPSGIRFSYRCEYTKQAG